MTAYKVEKENTEHTVEDYFDLLLKKVGSTSPIILRVIERENVGETTSERIVEVERRK